MAAFVGRGPPKREEGYWVLKTHSTTVEYSSSTTSNPPFYFFEVLEGLEELDVKETEYHPFKMMESFVRATEVGETTGMEGFEYGFLNVFFRKSPDALEFLRAAFRALPQFMAEVSQYGRDSLSRGSTEDDKVDTIADSLERMSAFRSKYVKRIRLVVDDPVPLQILTNNYDGTLEYIQMECQMLGANNELHDAVFGTLTYRKFLVFVVGNTRVRKELIRRYKEASRLIKISDISVSILIKAIILFFNIFLLTKITGSLGVGGSGGGE